MLYEWHETEREDLNEGRIWIRANHTANNILKDWTENRRPALLFKCSSKSVCCETLWADPRFLRNRHYPILIGTITDYNSRSNFKVRDEDKKASDEDKDAPGVDASLARFEHGDGRAVDPTEVDELLAHGPHVCVRGKRETDTGSVLATRVTFNPGGNLVFLSAWYRHCLGIDIKTNKPGSKVDLKILTPRWWLLQPLWWQLRACARHPQIAVVMSTVLAVVGTGLGIVGLATILKDVRWPSGVWEYVVWGIGAFGLLVFLVGFAPLFLRAKK